jgi:hypothetical protein
LTLSTLAAIWIVAAPLFLLASGALVARSGRFGYRQMLLLAGGALLALLALTLALGLHAAAGWARALHLALCLPLAMTCVFAPFAVVAAAYLLGARTRRHFTAPDGTPWPTAHDPRLERRFALSLAAAALLSVVLALAADLALRSAPGSETPVPPPGAAPVLARLRAMHSAQESFRRVCNLGFGDLEGLTNPASVLPGYPPHGPSFLAQDLVSAQDHGYRFALAVGGLMPPTSDCSTLRRYRIFEYTAAPLSGTGSFFRLSADGAIRVAEGRPARGGDPVLEQLR